LQLILVCYLKKFAFSSEFLDELRIFGNFFIFSGDFFEISGWISLYFRFWWVFVNYLRLG